MAARRDASPHLAAAKRGRDGVPPPSVAAGGGGTPPLPNHGLVRQGSDEAEANELLAARGAAAVPVGRGTVVRLAGPAAATPHPRLPRRRT